MLRRRGRRVVHYEHQRENGDAAERQHMRRSGERAPAKEKGRILTAHANSGPLKMEAAAGPGITPAELSRQLSDSHRQSARRLQWTSSRPGLDDARHDLHLLRSPWPASAGKPAALIRSGCLPCVLASASSPAASFALKASGLWMRDRQGLAGNLCA